MSAQFDTRKATGLKKYSRHLAILSSNRIYFLKNVQKSCKIFKPRLHNVLSTGTSIVKKFPGGCTP